MPSVTSTDVPTLWYVKYNTVQILNCPPFKSKQSKEKLYMALHLISLTKHACLL